MHNITKKRFSKYLNLIDMSEPYQTCTGSLQNMKLYHFLPIEIGGNVYVCNMLIGSRCFKEQNQKRILQ